MFGIFNKKDNSEYIYQYADMLSKSIMDNTFNINVAKTLYEIASSQNFTPKDLEKAQIESCFRLFASIAKYQQLTIENRYKFKKLLNICTALPNNIKEDWNNKISFSQNEILSHYKVLIESIDIFDNTKNLETAIMRYNLILEKFDNLNFCNDEQLSFYNTSKENLSSMVNTLKNNKVAIFNEVIKRMYEDKIKYVETLKSKNAKIKNITKTINKINSFIDLPEESIQYANTLLNQYLNDINAKNNK